MSCSSFGIVLKLRLIERIKKTFTAGQRNRCMSRSIVYRPNSDRSSNKTTRMSSASHWVSDGATKVPLPSKTSQLPTISLPVRLVPESVPALSHPLISFEEDDDPYCSSLPPIDRPKTTDQATNCSSSCDNLSLCTAASSVGDTTGDAGRLTKASSDNPIFGSGSPPIPPRDYIPRARSRPALEQKLHKPEIHPIVQDGQKCSNTHYWLLPDKQKMSSHDVVDRTGESGLYVNLSDAELWAKKFGIFNQITGHKKPAFGAKERGRSNHGGSDGAKEHGCRSDRSAEAVPLLSDVSSLDSMSVDISAEELEESGVNPSADERTTSMGEIKEMIERVQSKINGVTTDESYTALALHHWSVEAAVEYLKVENLFRLGLASREKCRWMLEANGWNLEKAASGLLDLVGVDSNLRKQ